MFTTNSIIKFYFRNKPLSVILLILISVSIAIGIISIVKSPVNNKKLEKDINESNLKFYIEGDELFGGKTVTLALKKYGKCFFCNWVTITKTYKDKNTLEVYARAAFSERKGTQLIVTEVTAYEECDIIAYYRHYSNGWKLDRVKRATDKPLKELQ